MPVNFQANFSELNRKCPDNYYKKMRTPGCLLSAKPFTPFAKGPSPAPAPGALLVKYTAQRTVGSQSVYLFLFVIKAKRSFLRSVVM